MLEQFKLKQELRMQEAVAEQQELQKISKYQSRYDERDKRHKLELAQKEKEKEAIYQRMKAAEQQRKK